MSDNNIDLSSNTERSIPTFVGQYRPKSNEKLSSIVFIDLDSRLSKAEKRVCDFFKCTVNWDQSQELVDNNVNEHQKCFATRQTAINFEKHLRERHSSGQEFFCVYCYHSLSTSNRHTLKTYPFKYLIKHMVKRHRFRHFQCNLCLYRALTKEHVIAHQKTDHSSEYSNAINYNVSQLADNTYCKIFLCPKLVESGNESRNLIFYYNKYKAERLNSQGKNETYFQCLYCMFMDERVTKVIDHCVQRHADYPILYYIPEPQISSSSDELVDDFSTYNNNNCVIQPKLEPQDNCVSSTQKSPEAQVIETNDNSTKRRLSTENSNNNNIKRIIVESSEGTAIPTNVNPINITESLSEEITVKKQKICLFCDQTFDVESDSAKTHLMTHFVDPENNRVVMDWIQLFLNKQEQMCSFTEKDTSLDSENTYYYCPLCVKLAKIVNKFPKNYIKYSDVRIHFWQHCWWLSKCKVCQSSVPNCDPIILKHFNDDPVLHIEILENERFQFLLNTQTEVTFKEEERTRLQKRCIEVKYNEVIDEMINKILVQIKEDFEKRLRIKNNCRKILVVPINRLSDQLFDKYLNEYIDYENKKRGKQQNLDNLTDKRSDKIEDKDNQMVTKKKRGPKKSNKSNESKDLGKNKNNEIISNESKERSDKTDFLQDLNAVKSSLSNAQPSCSTTNTTITTANSVSHNIANSSRVRLLSTSSRDTEPNRDSDTEHSEELNRISCYHCNDKFKTKREFKDHSNKVHPNLPKRMYQKPNKTNN